MRINIKYPCFLVGLGLVVVQALYAEIKPSGFAVTTAHPLATNVGLSILAKGGNAFDAAVAISATLAVVEPYHSGLGGGGFWLLHVAKDKKNIFIDGREAAPLAATKNMYLDSKGEIRGDFSLNGPLAAAIPGQPAALAYIASHYGRLPLSETLAPAIALAEKGFLVDHQYIYFIQMGDRQKQLSRFPASKAQFLHSGKPYVLGERLKQGDLAKTLKAVALKGHEGFYQGEVAQRLVSAVRTAGGIWTLDDLARYQIKVREPLVGAYHSMLVITAPPPSAGGVSLLTMLNILAHYPLSSLPKVQWVHYVIEAMRVSYWQRIQWLADPDFVKVPVERLVSFDNASALIKHIMPLKATSSDSLTEQSVDTREKSVNTTHFSILDQEGNRVSATLTINYIFGSSFVAAGTGVLLNDEMDDFTIKPGTQNIYGLVGGDINTIAPGKRPASMMTPTFLEMPSRVAILGTPGGSRIASMVLLSTLSFYDFSGAISMVSVMRFHHQFKPDWVQFEPDTFTPDLMAALKSMGYQLKPLLEYYGDMQAISWDKKSGVITAAADPRHIGLAAVVSNHKDGYGLMH